MSVVISWLFPISMPLAQSPQREHTHQLNNDEKRTVPIAEQVPTYRERNVLAVLEDEILFSNESPSRRKGGAVVNQHMHEKGYEIHNPHYKPDETDALTK